MAEKKVTKKTTSKASIPKDDKVSLEEIKKRKAEVLARIDAEIGDDNNEEKAGVDEVTDAQIEDKKITEEEKVISDDALSDEDAKELINEEIKEEPNLTEEEVKEEENDEDIIEEKEEIKEAVIENERKDVFLEEKVSKKEKPLSREELGSTFSAAEFGLVDRKGSKIKNLILFVVVFLLVAIVSALFYFFYTGALKFEQEQPEPEVVPTEAPTATPVPVEFDRAALSVQILNGSGISGEAGRAEEVLADLGYENIEIGNADGSDYLNITIQIKEELEEIVEFIIEDLESRYTVNADYEILEDDSEYDVVVIVGSEEEEEEQEEVDE